MNWDDPAARARLIDHVGAAKYNEMFETHRRASIVATVNGHDIRPVTSGRFGVIYMVGDTGHGFAKIDDAKNFAERN